MTSLSPGNSDSALPDISLYKDRKASDIESLDSRKDEWQNEVIRPKDELLESNSMQTTNDEKHTSVLDVGKILRNVAVICEDAPSSNGNNLASTPVDADVMSSQADGLSNDHLSGGPGSPSCRWMRVFSRSVLAGSRGCPLDCVALFNLSNTSGPQIRHLWMTENVSVLTGPALVQIAQRVMNGELCRETDTDVIDTKFYAKQEDGLGVLTFVFSAADCEFQQDLATYSLSVIVEQAKVSRLLACQPVSQNWMFRNLPKLRILLHKNRDSPSLAIEVFEKHLCDFASLLSSLDVDNIPTNISLLDTVFHAENSIESEFLHEAIASHLMTGGYTVVFGKTPNKVNMLIRTLALFLSSRQRHCSRLVTSLSAYQPDLVLQGLLKKPGAPLCESLNYVYYSSSPTTLLDLTTLDVKQTAMQPDFLIRRQALLQQELRAQWLQQPHVVYPTSELFYTYEETETLVTSFLDKLKLLADNDSDERLAYAHHFCRLIERKAMALVRYVDTLAPKSRLLLHQNVKRLRTDLGILTLGDFKIILAAADALKPGLYCHLMADPRTIKKQLRSVNS